MASLSELNAQLASWRRCWCWYFSPFHGERAANGSRAFMHLQTRSPPAGHVAVAKRCFRALKLETTVTLMRGIAACALRRSFIVFGLSRVATGFTRCTLPVLLFTSTSRQSCSHNLLCIGELSLSSLSLSSLSRWNKQVEGTPLSTSLEN